MSFLRRFNRPWLHFLLLGAALYYATGVVFPEPRPVIGPLGAARLEALQRQWFATTGEQMTRLVAAELDRDMLFQRALELDLHLYDSVIYQRLLRNMRFLGVGEDKSDAALYELALEMRMHLGDEVIKRRMIQVMEQMMLAANPPPPVTQAQIAAEFAARREELRRPPRYTLEHIYFSREREDEVAAVVEKIRRDGLDIEAARAFGSPFLPGYRFSRQTPDQLARHFGASFVVNLEATDPQPGTWRGPVRSTYGLHYVWVAAVEPERAATLDEVRAQLQRDLAYRARAAALRESIDRLRERYEVIAS